MAANNITLLLQALIAPCQDIESAVQQMLTETGINAASGAQLDVLGKIVGLPRNGLSDALYQRALRAQIATNRSQGVSEDLITVAVQIINDPTANVRISTLGIAGYLLEWRLTVPAAGVADVLIELLNEAQSAGVRGILETLVQPENATFACAIAAFPSSALSIGQTAINVGSIISTFPPAGTLDINPGLADYEQVAYTAVDGSNFLEVAALTKNHVAGSQVSLHQTGLGFPFEALASAGFGAGAGTISVDNTTSFPSSGSLVLDPGLTTQETVAYAGKTTTSFTGVTGVTKTHATGAVIYPATGSQGGAMRDARDRVLGF